ncbi:MAG: PQQ-binding-like beta-propeller repeat protein [Streptosporangiaceae bacterium]|nr:PQQ-binding-like beta-propeller repeat protein [Streptosporangiaceae bacterium]
MNRHKRLVMALALTVVAGVAVACSGGTPGRSFKSGALLDAGVRVGAGAAGTTWPVFGGGTDNTRFSALSQINTGNVGHLGVAWSAPLGRYSSLSEDYPVMTGRTLYVSSSTDEVMAYDAVTGARTWAYAPQVDFTLSRGVGGYGVTVNRGVAVSGGNVYLLTFDDHLQALSQATGEELWSNVVADAHTGAYETSAPTVWQKLVFGGDSGSEDGVRGFVAAYDAGTGSQVWRFWTVPAPGQGWVPKGPHGGGTIYMPPTIDTSSGLLYAGTGNPSPTIVGTSRPGPDLYTDSILALDARTGKLAWYHQQVAHDLWDYDAASPVMVFDAVLGGKKVRAVAEAGKSGYFFVLDAATGRNLFPPVPFVTQKHSPPTAEGVLECPGSLGGAQYGPSAFSPVTRAAYVTGLNVCMTLKVGPASPGTGEKDFGGTSSIPPGLPQTGTVTAVDTGTGHVLWARTLPAPMIGGATATAGGLVFAGDAHGTLYAFDARTGEQVWHAYLGLAIGAAPIVYSVGGTEYLALVVGGSPLSANFGWGNVGARIVVLKLGGSRITPYPPAGGSGA